MFAQAADEPSQHAVKVTIGQFYKLSLSSFANSAASLLQNKALRCGVAAPSFQSCFIRQIVAGEKEGHSLL